MADLGYDMGDDELLTVRDLLDGTAKGRVDPEVVKKHLIQPVRDQNWPKWKTTDGQ